MAAMVVKWQQGGGVDCSDDGDEEVLEVVDLSRSGPWRRWWSAVGWPQVWSDPVTAPERGEDRVTMLMDVSIQLTRQY
nr:hypothetical protein [Tanacetum cinerariifolium]